MKLLFLVYNLKLNSDINKKCVEKSSLTMDDEHKLTKSELEKFLTKLSMPTCKCSTTRQQTTRTHIKSSSMDDNITCISLDNHSSLCSLSTQKKMKQTTIKCIVIFIKDLMRELYQIVLLIVDFLKLIKINYTRCRTQL